jgi:hypothetical protein
LSFLRWSKNKLKTEFERPVSVIIIILHTPPSFPNPHEILGRTPDLKAHQRLSIHVPMYPAKEPSESQPGVQQLNVLRIVLSHRPSNLTAFRRFHQSPLTHSVYCHNQPRTADLACLAGGSYKEHPPSV